MALKVSFASPVWFSGCNGDFGHVHEREGSDRSQVHHARPGQRESPGHRASEEPAKDDCSGHVLVAEDKTWTACSFRWFIVLKALFAGLL
jgi:hypothetical protein